MHTSMSATQVYSEAKRAEVYWSEKLAAVKEAWIKEEAEKKEWTFWPFVKDKVGYTLAKQRWEANSWDGGQGHGYYYYEAEQLRMARRLKEFTYVLQGQQVSLTEKEVDALKIK